MNLFSYYETSARRRPNKPGIYHGGKSKPNYTIHTVLLSSIYPVYSSFGRLTIPLDQYESAILHDSIKYLLVWWLTCVPHCACQYAIDYIRNCYSNAWTTNTQASRAHIRAWRDPFEVFSVNTVAIVVM